jgi:hypothetical protein
MNKILLKLLKILSETKQKTESIFGESDYLYEEIDMIWEAIAEYYEIDLGLMPEGDRAIEIMNDYSEGKISIYKTDKLLKELTK